MSSTRSTRRREALQARRPFERLPGSLKPFKRASALLAQMEAIMDKGLIPTDRQMELDALPPYFSRGHGGRYRTKARLSFRDRSKYDPREEDMKHYPTEANAKARAKLGLEQTQKSPRSPGYSAPALLAYVDRIAARPIEEAA